MKQAKVKIMKRFVCMLVVIGLLLTLAPMAALPTLEMTVDGNQTASAANSKVTGTVTQLSPDTAGPEGSEQGAVAPREGGVLADAASMPQANGGSLQSIAPLVVGTTFTHDGLKYIPLTEDDDSKTGTVMLNGFEGPSVDTLGPTSATVSYGTYTYTVTAIGANAFYRDINLTSVDLSALTGLTHIGDGAFREAANLASVDLSGLTGLTHIGSRAFQMASNTKLGTLTLPNTAYTIGDRAFEGCFKLTSIDISGATALGDYAFGGCTKLGSAVLGSGLTAIGERAFKSCYALDSVDFSAIGGSYTIGDYAFCDTLLTAMQDSDLSKATSIGNNAFQGCGLAGTVNLSGTAEIGSEAFAGCSNITGVTFGNSLRSIGRDAFQNCTLLNTVVFPTGGSGYNIGDYAFSSAPLGSMASLDLKKATSIGKESFSGRTAINTIELGSGLTAIGEKAFDGCTGLTSVTFPTTHTYTIGDRAFIDTALTTDPSGPPLDLSMAARIGDEAFRDVSTLTGTLKLPTAHGYEIGTSVFRNTGITGMVDLSKATIIGSYSFVDTNITGITLPTTGGGYDIESYAFSGCTGLTGFIDLSKAARIEDSAFESTSFSRVLFTQSSAPDLGSLLFNGSGQLPTIFYPKDAGYESQQGIDTHNGTKIAYTSVGEVMFTEDGVPILEAHIDVSRGPRTLSIRAGANGLAVPTLWEYTAPDTAAVTVDLNTFKPGRATGDYTQGGDITVEAVAAGKSTTLTLNALTDASTTLTIFTTDSNNLSLAIGEANTELSNMPKDAYEKNGVDALEKSLKTALAVYSDINASQPEMDKAEKELRDAIDALVPNITGLPGGIIRAGDKFQLNTTAVGKSGTTGGELSDYSASSDAVSMTMNSPLTVTANHAEDGVVITFTDYKNRVGRAQFDIASADSSTPTSSPTGPAVDGARTGDESNIILWIALCAALGIIIAGVLRFRKRKSDVE